MPSLLGNKYAELDAQEKLATVSVAHLLGAGLFNIRMALRHTSVSFFEFTRFMRRLGSHSRPRGLPVGR